MREFFLTYGALIISALALLMSLSSFLLSFKVRRDGIVLKLTPKFTAYFERAEKKDYYNHYTNQRGEVGYEVRVRLMVSNPAPYTLEIREIKSSNYLLTEGDMNLETQKGYQVLIPGKLDSNKTLIGADKAKMYFFTAFIFEKELSHSHRRFPDMTLMVGTLQHSDPPVEKIFRVVRPVKPGYIKETR
jgi:hypothetical protein